MLVTKEQFLRVLKDIESSVEADDSFEGHLEYHAEGRHEFELTATYRGGNSEGQGGTVIIQ